MLGPTMEVIEEYQNYERSRDAEPATVSGELDAPPAEGSRFGGDTHLGEVTLGGDCHEGAIVTGQTLKILVLARVAPASRAEGLHVGIVIVRNDMLRCYGVSTEIDEFELEPLADGEYGVSFVVEELPLLAGQYSLQVGLLDGNGVHVYDLWKGIAPFKVSHGTTETGLVRLSHRWEHP